jgi:hypothetical protein
MAAFLAPTRRKISWTLLGLLVLPGCLLLRTIPVQWDLLDLREAGGLVLGLLFGVPIWIFDLVTGSAFAAKSEGFLRFPSLAELLSALVGNLLLFYLISCTAVRYWERRRRSQQSPRPTSS